MFKAKLIENPRYYKLLRNQSLLLILLLLPYLWLMSYMDIPAWGTGLSFITYLVAIILAIRNNTAIRKIINQKELQINGDQIRMLNKKNHMLSEWKVLPGDTIITNKNFSMPNGKFPEIFQAWKRQPVRNFLELKKGSDDVHFEFHLDSDYMRVQISKIIDCWISKGIKVKRV